MNRRDEQERRAFEWGRASGLGLTQPLGLMRRGGVGRILAVRGGDHDREVERGLLEMGFVEGACVEALHHGFLGQDPLAVCINQTMTIALRRCEANAVLVGPLLWAYAPAGLFSLRRSSGRRRFGQECPSRWRVQRLRFRIILLQSAGQDPSRRYRAARTIPIPVIIKNIEKRYN